MVGLDRVRSGEGSVLSLFRRINSHLSSRRKRQTALLGVLTVLGAFAEFLSLGALLPFLAALVAPDKIISYPVVSWLAGGLESRSNDQVVLLFALLFVALILVTAVIRLVLSYGNTRLAVAIGSEFTTAAFRRVLDQPYEKFVHLDSSLLISNIDKSNTVALGFFQPALQVISSSTIVAAVVAGLLIVDPTLTALLATIVGGCYLGIIWLTKTLIERNGRIIADSLKQRVRVIQEGFGGFRDIVLSGTQHLHNKTFHASDWSIRWAHGTNLIVATSPRIIVEAVGAVALAVTAYFLSRGEEGVAEMLPVLGALAFGAQRLIPAVQQLFYSWSSLTAGKANVADALDLLERLDHTTSPGGDQPRPAPLGLQHKLSLRGVQFRYDMKSPWVLDGVDLSVEKGECVGIVGVTGEGKSTLLDVCMGLLPPTGGEIHVDGHSLQDATRLAWQETIAHVPQKVFLADLSFAGNIALGIPADEIDRRLLEQVSAMAQLESTISKSPLGYATMVGEQGIRLSGGQRQRIGIARALYRQRSVLVLDEATSSLDSDTEELVLSSLMNLDDVTILMVAHRPSTLSRCNRLFVLSEGLTQQVDSPDKVSNHDLFGSTAEPAD